MSVIDFILKQSHFTSASIQEDAVVQCGVKPHTVRARVSECAASGLIEQMSRGVYRVVRGDTSCLCINGDGRDISFASDQSIDCIITDHPYDTSGALDGGNRNFAQYERFQYTLKDFKEKARVLKDGAFLVEFLPEENVSNWRYLARLKQLACEAGFEYYTKVPWVKGDFIANTGRKSKNTEEVMFFTKGKARCLRPGKAGAPLGSGAAGMLPTVFNVQSVYPSDRIHQAEKPVKLLEQIIDFVTVKGECVLDQFAGSGATSIAAMSQGREAICIEKDEVTFNRMVNRLCDFKQGQLKLD